MFSLFVLLIDIFLSTKGQLNAQYRSFKPENNLNMFCINFLQQHFHIRELTNESPYIFGMYHFVVYGLQHKSETIRTVCKSFLQLSHTLIGFWSSTFFLFLFLFSTLIFFQWRERRRLSALFFSFLHFSGVHAT